MDPQDVLCKSYTESIHSSLRASIDPAMETDDESYIDKRRPSCTDISRYPSSYHTSMVPSASNLSIKRPSMTENMTNLDTHILSRTTTATSNNEYDGLPDYPDSVYTQNDDTPTPLPKMQMFIICIILFSEPLTSTILLPFIYFMLKDFHLSDDEKEIGLYAGWITSMFFLAQFCTAMMWGRLSDRHGRRPVLLTGLIGNTISATSFGMSKNIWWAIGTRTFCGIMNGNAAVARSALAELADASNRAKAFSLFGFCWGIGMIAGPTIGGYLCKPAEQFPDLFGDNEFLKEYPYFLPCFVASLGSMVGFVIGFFYLKETNPAVLERQRSEKSKYGYIAGAEAEETRSLLRSSTRNISQYSVRAAGGEMPVEEDEESKTAAFKLSSASKMTIAAYAVWAFHAMILDEVLPLYFSAPSYAGGLGSNSQEFAKALAIGGIQQLFCQFYLYPKINQYLPTLTMARIAGYLFVPVYILFPELSTLKEWLLFHATQASGSSAYLVFQCAYMCLIFVRFFANCLSITSLMIMVTNSADPRHLGVVNGILQSCLALVRAFAPTVGGTLWSYSLTAGFPFPFDRHFVYYLIAAMALLNLFQLYRIPEFLSIGGRKTQKSSHV